MMEYFRATKVRFPADSYTILCELAELLYPRESMIVEYIATPEVNSIGEYHVTFSHEELIDQEYFINPELYPLIRKVY